MAELFEKIDSFAAVSGIEAALQGTQSVICAFSGGADSSVLLRWLHSRLPAFGKRLVAAHVNHMIRGEEGDADEAFCRRVCEGLGIPLYVEKVDVPARAAGSGMGLEECAREVRYAFLSDLSERLGGAAVATAHSATDNLETVIFHMTRGSGVRGVAGIAPVREIYIRPLICCYSEEIREYAKESGIEYVT
ncbi:MAG: tRNA lysidine(34) synthetase TilS, partial [Candidatus Avispirillum sp.]